MSHSDSWSQAEKVLCVRLDALGDLVMTSPAMRALKRSRPGRQLALLTSPAGAAVAGLIPDLEEVIVYEAPWMKASPARPGAELDFAMIERIRAARFDAAVIFTVYSQNPLPPALFCYLAEIPLRLAHCHENPYHLLTDWVPDPEPQQLVRHEVRRQLDLVATVGARIDDERLCLRVPREARRRVRERLSELGLDHTVPWVLMHPGSTAPSRRYPPESFAKAAQRLVTEHGIPVVFTGTQGEVALVESIREAMGAPSYSLAGKLDIAELTALIELAPVLVSNNTGPVHLAAAVGTPVVDLYALTNPQHTPWAVSNRVLFHDVPCRYCYKSTCPEGHHDCLRLVPPSLVVEAAIELLRRAGQIAVNGTHGAIGSNGSLGLTLPSPAVSAPGLQP